MTLPARVQVTNKVVAVGRTYLSELTTPAGIVVGAAYADLDSIGTGLVFDGLPTSGVILTATYYDQDDEGLQVDLFLFREPVLTQTDNGAVALADLDLVKAVGRIQFTAFADLANGQFSTVNNIGMAYSLPGKKLYAIVQARGALNIAVNSLPAFRLTILADE